MFFLFLQLKKMKNNYVFEDWPVKLCLEKFDSAKINLKDEFAKKYPELKDRFEVLNKELMFTISKESEMHEHNWSVDFLESNVNEGRPYNGLGRKLSEEIYTDLFQLFCDNGNVFFASSNDNCIVETVGEFDSRCSFKLKNDGLHWELEEEEEDWDDEEGW